MRSSTRLRDHIVRRLNRTLFEFDTEELEFMMTPSYGMTPSILEYMELTLYARTQHFRSRCQMWEHKLDLSKTQYPTLTKLIAYRHIYENWDGKEPFPSREVKRIKYYLD